MFHFHYGPRLARSAALLVASFVLALAGLRTVVSNGDWRLQQRECFGIQKNLRGAREMYALDFSGVPAAQARTVPAAELVRQGYLRAVPEDPGSGPGSEANFLTTDEGEVACLRHGFLQLPQGTDRETCGVLQLRAAGIDPGRQPVGAGMADWIRSWPRKHPVRVVAELVFMVSALLLPLGMLLGCAAALDLVIHFVLEMAARIRE